MSLSLGRYFSLLNAFMGISNEKSLSRTRKEECINVGNFDDRNKLSLSLPLHHPLRYTSPQRTQQLALSGRSRLQKPAFAFLTETGMSFKGL